MQNYETNQKRGTTTMSQTSSREDRRRPPQRLSWPTSLSQDSTKTITGIGGNTMPSGGGGGDYQQGSRNKKNRKRSRSSAGVLSNDDKDAESFDSSIMWVEQFAPASSSDLCVAPKKVKEIESWMQQNCSSVIDNKNNYAAEVPAKSPGKQKLLILVGSPGVGKSTAVRIIAKKLNLSILSWNESFNPRDQQPQYSFDPLFSLEQTSALDSFNEFLQQSGCGFVSLNLTSSSSSLSAAIDTSIIAVKNKNNLSSSSSRKKSGSSSISGSNINNNSINRSIILLEDLPNLHGTDQEMRFRAILNEHLHRSQVPTILVFSDVFEGKHKPKDLERLIDPNDLYDNDQTRIVQIQGVTKPKMRKILSNIVKQVKCRNDSDIFDEIHRQSQGDIRHAIMTLQLHATALSNRTITTSCKNGQNSRDMKLSAFHSLGKLLYAKRVLENDGGSRLAFDPEHILERSDLGVDGSLKFLEFHSPDFFTDIKELSKAYDYFSDAAYVLGNETAEGSRRSYDTSSAFPYVCASSIAGRAVANTNIHPAANKFRQFSRPKTFDVIRNRRQNQVLVDQLSRKVSRCHCLLPNFVTEALPFLRQISPQEVDPFLDNLYSAAAQSYKEKKKLKGENNNNDNDGIDDDRMLKEQEDLLQLDDIGEFDSDSDN